MKSEDEGLRICAECIGDSFLKAEIQSVGIEAPCSYCEGEEKTVSVEEIANRIEEVLNDHFARTPDEPPDNLPADLDFDWERDGDPILEIIQEIAMIEPEPADDVRAALEQKNHDPDPSNYYGEERPFDEDAHYRQRKPNAIESRDSWMLFEKNLKTKERYFSRSAEETLAYVFEGITEQQTEKGLPVIVEAGPGKMLSAIYRARVAQTTQKLVEVLEKPDLEVGPPPAKEGRAGRMNAHGISVFYGVTNEEIALAEVRPPVGSWVVTGGFEFLRTVRLLDVEALQSVNTEGSFFDPAYTSRLERAGFLAWLSERITRPVVPDDEVLDYLPTQAVADFLATKVDPPLDGILYRSVQSAKVGSNIVLFHKAARVPPLEIPEGTTIDVRLYDYEGSIDIVVTESSPSKAQREAEVQSPFEFDSSGSSAPSLGKEDARRSDVRQPTIQLLLPSLKAHAIKSVQLLRTPTMSVDSERKRTGL